MACLTILTPWILLLLAARSEVPAPYFFLISALLPSALSVYRWDIAGYSLVAVPFVAYPATAFLQRGVWGGLFAFLMIALPWLLLRLHSRHRGINLEFPLRDGVFYIAHGGSLRLSNYHGRFVHSQKYALDITQLNFLGMRARGFSPEQLISYRIYGAAVYSPCAGTVRGTHDGVPDVLPGVRQNQQQPAGNFVLIQPEGSGIDLLLAHLQPGSLLVKTGDSVIAGQPIGRVGNSGHTTEPHLHVHAQLSSGDIAGNAAPVPIYFRGRWLVRNSLVRSRG